MKPSFLVNVKEQIAMRSKKPWACFETNGLSENGLGISIHWNRAFIENINAAGIHGTTDEETLQLFFMFMSSRISDGISDGAINPEATPTLTNEANRFIR